MEALLLLVKMQILELDCLVGSWSCFSHCEVGRSPGTLQTSFCWKGGLSYTRAIGHVAEHCCAVRSSAQARLTRSPGERRLLYPESQTAAVPAICSHLPRRAFPAVGKGASRHHCPFRWTLGSLLQAPKESGVIVAGFELRAGCVSGRGQSRASVCPSLM